MSQDLTGRCLCGAVTWQAKGPVLWAGHCHCESCRRATSAPFTSFLGVPREGLSWQGAMTARVTSQGQVKRRFCSACGTQMAYDNEIWPDETHLYAASLDDPTGFAPQAHYHWAERLPWIIIKDDLTKHAGAADAPDQRA